MVSSARASDSSRRTSSGTDSPSLLSSSTDPVSHAATSIALDDMDSRILTNSSSKQQLSHSIVTNTRSGNRNIDTIAGSLLSAPIPIPSRKDSDHPTHNHSNGYSRLESHAASSTVVGADSNSGGRGPGAFFAGSLFDESTSPIGRLLAFVTP